MKNMKKFMAVMAVASLVATSTVTVSAFEYEGPQGTTSDEEATAHGHTTFSVVEAEENNDPSNVSFTVPLYVTMAVIDGSDEVQTPSNYEIRNTSQASTDPNGNATAYDISVIGMNFEKLEGSTYDTVADASASSDNREMELSIGGYVMPALSVATAVDVILSAKTGTSFYNAGSFTVIKPNGVLDLPLAAKLGAEAEIDDNTPAVAQFQVKYTVGAVVKDGDGNDMILAVYAGDDRIAAGLEAFESSTSSDDE